MQRQTRVVSLGSYKWRGATDLDIHLYNAKCAVSDIVKFQSSFGIAEVVVCVPSANI